MYPEELIAPMRQEAVQAGCEELKTSEEVQDALDDLEGTALVFINSVCGCAAGMARPGLAFALKNAPKKPTHAFTVFAGNDREAAATAREYFTGYPPSSPCMGLIKDGEIVAMVQRLDIEGHSAEQVAQKLTDIFNEYC
ncbi:MAG: BrxA/BrxB family bacilliredoxin [Lentisphaeria bacterium]|nr:BrxA/BrxB family bacilliredoxin [Lentisphaeria bacterium]